MRYVALAAGFDGTLARDGRLRRALHRSAACAGRDRPQADPGNRPRAARAAGNLPRSAPLRLRHRRERRRHAPAGDARIRDPGARAAGDPLAGAAPASRHAAHGRQLDRAHGRGERGRSERRAAQAATGLPARDQSRRADDAARWRQQGVRRVGCAARARRVAAQPGRDRRRRERSRALRVRRARSGRAERRPARAARREPHDATVRIAKASWSWRAT